MNDSQQIQEEGSAVAIQRRRLLYAGVAATAGLCGAGLALWNHSATDAGEKIDPSLWQRKFETPAGGTTLDMTSFQGKPLVLNFWATWCPPCVEEMPLLNRFFRENSSKGWQVVGLAIDKPESVRRFLRDFAVGYPIGMAESDGIGLAQSLGNLSGGLPFSLVITGTGAIVQRKIGRLSPSDLSAWASFEFSG